MNFKEWSNKYYPNESQETLHKMSHAWAASWPFLPPNQEVINECACGDVGSWKFVEKIWECSECGSPFTAQR